MASGIGCKPILELARHLSLPQSERLPGSYGHPQLCQQPCVHMLRAGSCKAGVSCSFCHEQHHRPPRKISKRFRDELGKMERATVMDLLLPHIYLRVMKHNLLPEARELMQSLESERHSERQHLHLDLSSTDVLQLNTELSKLPLLALAAG